MNLNSWIIISVFFFLSFKEKNMEGTYVVSVDRVNADSSRIKVFSDDSLFVIGHYVLEKTTIMVNTIIDDQQQEQKIKPGRFYLINLAENCFVEYLTQTAPRSYDKHPLNEKKNGFYFIPKNPVYAGEGVSISNVVIDKIALRKIHFVSRSKGKLNGTNINLYVTQNFIRGRDFLVDKIVETKFRGSLVMVEYDYGNQGKFIANYKFQKGIPLVYKAIIKKWSN